MGRRAPNNRELGQCRKMTMQCTTTAVSAQKYKIELQKEKNTQKNENNYLPEALDVEMW